MNTKRRVEVFSAGCPLCEEAVEMVKRISCQDCVINVLDMKDHDVAERAIVTELASHAVSKDVNSVKNNEPTNIVPLSGV
ncbi:MAG: hypothetical protein LJE66_02895 [Desulfobacterales bacterium]|jgi:hypothetical protein|nr:hypothetical protein [Desulfobacterales bacterium]